MELYRVSILKLNMTLQYIFNYKLLSNFEEKSLINYYNYLVQLILNVYPNESIISNLSI